MSKTVSIHQPNFLPWPGYFYKIMRSDVFVFLDDVQYIKRSFISRNQIKTKDGAQYICLPLIQKNRYKQKILECEIINKKDSVKNIINTIKTNYSKAKYFKDYFDDFCEILNIDTNKLSEFNIFLIEWVMKILDIKFYFKKSSDLKDICETSTGRLIEICKKVGCNKYLSGFGGNKYQDNDMFEREKIKLIITDFVSPIYPQLWGEFIPNLSIIDLIFNCGKESKDIIMNSFKKV